MDGFPWTAWPKLIGIIKPIFGLDYIVENLLRLFLLLGILLYFDCFVLIRIVNKIFKQRMRC